MSSPVSRPRGPRISTSFDWAPTLVKKEGKAPPTKMYVFEDVMLAARLNQVAILGEDYDHCTSWRRLLIGNGMNAHTTR